MKAPTPKVVIVASQPPATTTSASPHWILLKASPTEWVPVAHADATHLFKPLYPCFIETLPDAISTINIGTVKGEPFVGPFVCIAMWFCSNVLNPPAAELTITPILYGSISASSIPESAIASSAATIANCVNLSIRFASFGPISSSGLKSFALISPAIVTVWPSVEMFSKVVMPLLPSNIEFQKSFTFVPQGVTAPIPVTTTLLLFIFRLSPSKMSNGKQFSVRYLCRIANRFY